MSNFRAILVFALVILGAVGQNTTSSSVPLPDPSSSLAVSSSSALEPSLLSSPVVPDASSSVTPSSAAEPSSSIHTQSSSSLTPEPSPSTSSSAHVSPSPTPPAPTPPTTTTTHLTTTTKPKPSPSDDIHAIKAAVLAGGWIPFTIVLVISIIFSWGFVRFYRHKRESSAATTIVTVISMVVAILTTSLIPVDVYLVSALKKTNGEFKDWGLDNHDTISDTMQYAYLTLYGLMVALVFCIVPLVYFFFEERDDENKPSCCKKFFNALKYTLAVMFVMAVLMCIGAFVLHSDGTACPQQNGTTPEDWIKCRANFAEKALTDNGGTNAISFTTGFLAVVGLLYFVMYTGIGLVALPIDLIRSSKADKEDRLLADEQLESNRRQQQEIESKYGGDRKKMSRRDRNRLQKYKDEEKALGRAVDRADEITASLHNKCSRVCKPFAVVFGVVFLLVSWFVVISLAITSGDKLLQIIKNDDLDWKTGYTQAASKTPNPLDLMLKAFQNAFPVDYIVISLLMFYLLMATIAGVRKAGVRYCGFKLFSIRPQRTIAQGLLFLGTIIMFTLLFTNIIFLTLAPQYITYGNQHYSVASPYDKSKSCFPAPEFPAKSELCGPDADRFVYLIEDMVNNKTIQIDSGGFFNDSGVFPNNCAYDSITICGPNGTTTTLSLKVGKAKCLSQPACVSTRVAALLHAFFYNLWFFGAIYYWANWAFILVFIIAFVYLTCARKQSLLQRVINDSKENWEEDDDDDMQPFNPSWLRK